jgi:hypothetical protein
MATEYRAFDLRVREVGQDVWVEAIGPDGEWAQSRTEIPAQHVEERFSRLRERQASMEPSVMEEDMEEIGDLLGQALMPGSILQLYTAARQRNTTRFGQGLRLVLHFLDSTRKYQRLPWEAIRINQQSVAMDPYQAVVRTVDLPEPAISLEVDRPPYRILVVAEAPRGSAPLEYEKETTQIKDQLTPLIDRGLIQIEVHHNATLAQVESLLRQEAFHILHFMGHALINEDGNGLLGFVKDDHEMDEVDGRRLGNAVLGTEVRMVFLNSNETAYGRGMGIGVAEALLKVGVPIIVAYNYEVLDRVATAFSGAFYKELIEANSLEQAMFAGRRALEELSPRCTLYWANPVLLTRASSDRFWRGEAGYKIETFLKDGKLVAEATQQGEFDAKAFANRMQTALENMELIEARDDRLMAQQLVAKAQDAILYSEQEQASKRLSEALTHIYLAVSEEEKQRKLQEDAQRVELEKEQAERKSRWTVLGISIVLLLVVGLLAYLLHGTWTPDMSISVIALPVSVVVWSFVGGVAAMLQAFVGTKRRDASERINYEWLLWRPIVGVVMGCVVYLAIAAGLVMFGEGDFTSLANTQNPYFLWALAFLGGFSDRFAILVFDNVVRTVSGSSGDEANSENEYE